MNCGREVVRNRLDGTSLIAESTCNAHLWVGRFTPDCRSFTSTGPTVHLDLATRTSTPSDPAWRLDTWSRDDRFPILEEWVPTDEDRDPDLRVVRSDDLVEVARVDGADPFGRRSFSADGAWFAYPRDPGRLELVHLPDGRRVSAQPAVFDVSTVAFSAAGDRAAYLSYRDVDAILADLVLVDLSTGATTVLDSLASRAAPRHAPPERPLAFDATGRWLAWISRQGSLYLADLAAGGDGVRVSEGPVTDLVFGAGELAWISRGYLLVAAVRP